MFKPWHTLGYSTSAARLMYNGEQKAVIDFCPNSLSAAGPDDWALLDWIVAACNEKALRDRPRDETL